MSAHAKMPPRAAHRLLQTLLDAAVELIQKEDMDGADCEIWHNKVLSTLVISRGSNTHDVQLFADLAHRYPAVEAMGKGATADRADQLYRAIEYLSHSMDLLAAEAGLDEEQGDRVFIGHGRSAAWRDLRDFLKDRLDLPVEEINRVAIAGTATVERLQEMLNASTFAFLVLTAEDETAEGRVRARQNVVHEVGLFQGRLGFKRAIVLLEDGCEEFSNIAGLSQLRFPTGNVKAVFEEIRRVLEREKLISGNGTAF